MQLPSAQPHHVHVRLSRAGLDRLPRITAAAVFDRIAAMRTNKHPHRSKPPAEAGSAHPSVATLDAAGQPVNPVSPALALGSALCASTVRRAVRCIALP